MKSILVLSVSFISGLILISQGSVARAADPGVLVPVADVSVVAVPPGCGAPPRPGGHRINCPAQTDVSFRVEAGGTCHNYSAAIVSSPHGPLLKIFDAAMPNCTRPEEHDFSTSVAVTSIPSSASESSSESASANASGPLRLANPLYVKFMPRP